MNNGFARIKCSFNLLAGSESLFQSISLFIRILGQSIIFLLIAKEYSSTELGMFVIYISVINIFGIFSDLDSSYRIQLDVLNGSELNDAISSSSSVVLLTSGIAIATAIPFCILFIHPSLALIPVFIFISFNLISGRITNIFNTVLNLLKRNKINIFLESLNNMLLILSIVFCHMLNLKFSLWIVLYSASGLIVGIIRISMLKSMSGNLYLSSHNMFFKVNQGISMSFSNMSTLAYGEIDKVLLGSFGLPHDAAIHAIGQRASAIVTVPIISRLNVKRPNLIKKHTEGKFKIYYLKYLKINSLMGVVASLFLFLFAPTISGVIGGKLYAAEDAIKFYSLFVLIQTMQYTLGEYLTVMSRQIWRTWIQVTAVLVNFVFNYCFIPVFGWKASIGTAILTQSYILIAFLIVIITMSIIERNNCA